MDPDEFGEVFNNFIMREVGGPYWRPVTWTLDSMTKYFWAYNPIPYHLTNIIIYSLICFLLYLFLRKLGFDETRALLGSLIFSSLPSHELSVAWIAGRTDTVMTLFLLAALVVYLKDNKTVVEYLVAIVLFVLAALSKEPAFAAAVLPIFIHSIIKIKTKIKSAYTESLFSVLLVIIILIYRFVVIGGTPFQSSNFDDIGIGSILFNFLAYLPVSIIRADTLESLFYLIGNNIMSMIIAVISGIAVILILISRYRAIESEDKRMFLFGLIWFVLFIIPATARFGQWYAFTSSIGVVISFMSLFKFDLKSITSKLLYFLIIIMCLVSSGYMAIRSSLWHQSSVISQSAFQSLTYPAKVRDTLLLIGVPDKYNMINCSKIGCEQAVWHRYNSKNIEVSSPLRMEFTDESKISFKIISDSVFVLYLQNGRFLPVGSRSRAVIVPETLNYDDGFQSFKIITRTDIGVQSKAIITIKEKSLLNRIFLFTGRKFVHLE